MDLSMSVTEEMLQVQFLSFLTSAIDGGQRSATNFGRRRYGRETRYLLSRRLRGF
jgi:hypothetical protein